MDESYTYLNEEPTIVIDPQQQHQQHQQHQQQQQSQQPQQQAPPQPQPQRQISDAEQHQFPTHQQQQERHAQESEQQNTSLNPNPNPNPNPNSNHEQLQNQQTSNNSNDGQEASQQTEEDTMGDGIFGNVTQGLEGNYRNMLMAYWQETIDSIEHDEHDFKNHQLPLARIKKVMKTDEEVRMISAEAPILFAKGCDIFITELTMRAWIHAEENKRRTLQKSDIAAALQKSDMFDFLIDIVPREDDKPQPKRQQSTSSRQNSLNFPSIGNVNNVAQGPRNTADNINSSSSLAEHGESSREFIEEKVNNVPNEYQYNELSNYENRY